MTIGSLSCDTSSFLMFYYYNKSTVGNSLIQEIPNINYKSSLLIGSLHNLPISIHIHIIHIKIQHSSHTNINTHQGIHTLHINPN